MELLRKIALTVLALAAAVFAVRHAPYLVESAPPELPAEARPAAVRSAALPAVVDDMELNGVPMKSQRLRVSNCRAVLWEPRLLGFCAADCFVLSRENDLQAGTMLWLEGPGLDATGMQAAAGGFADTKPDRFAGAESLHYATTQCAPDGRHGSVTHTWLRLDQADANTSGDSLAARRVSLLADAKPAGSFAVGGWRIYVDEVADPATAVGAMERALNGKGWRALEAGQPALAEDGIRDARVLLRGREIAMLTQRTDAEQPYLLTVYSGGGSFPGESR